MQPLKPKEDPRETNSLLVLTIAHDLRNPLATLTQLLYLMEHQFEPKYLLQMKRQLMVCESIVGNVLALAGLGPSEKRTVPVTELIRDAASQVSFPQGIRLGIDDSVVSVFVDRNQLIQALVNVLRNAVEAIGEGEGRIHVGISQTEKAACVQLSDSGPGFPVSVLESRFQPVVSLRKNGLGIGLAAAARIIASNQGRIALENLPERGARCSLYLPLA